MPEVSTHTRLKSMLQHINMCASETFHMQNYGADQLQYQIHWHKMNVCTELSVRSLLNAAPQQFKNEI